MSCCCESSWRCLCEGGRIGGRVGGWEEAGGSVKSVREACERAVAVRLLQQQHSLLPPASRTISAMLSRRRHWHRSPPPPPPPPPRHASDCGRAALGGSAELSQRRAGSRPRRQAELLAGRQRRGRAEFRAETLHIGTKGQGKGSVSRVQAELRAGEGCAPRPSIMGLVIISRGATSSATRWPLVWLACEM